MWFDRQGRPQFIYQHPMRFIKFHILYFYTYRWFLPFTLICILIQQTPANPPSVLLNMRPAMPNMAK